MEGMIINKAEEYKGRTLEMLKKQDAMQSTLLSSFRRGGEDSATRLQRILEVEHPEYKQLVIINLS
jgi:hypothetical protein